MTSNILIEINHFFSQNDKKGAKKKRKLYRFFLVNYNLLNILNNIMKMHAMNPAKRRNMRY